jgi:hypothetical protein
VFRVNPRRSGRRAGKTIWFELAPAAADAPAGVSGARARVFRRRRRGSSFFVLQRLRISPALA